MRVTAYEILGVEKDAPAADIKAAWKRLAIKWHPDRCAIKDALAGIAWRFAEEAYATLSSPEKRAEYDRKLDKIPPTVKPVQAPGSDPLSDTLVGLAGDAASAIMGKILKGRVK